MTLPLNMPTVPAMTAGCKGRSGIARGLPAALPERAAGGRGEADNELIARRSTAARSANSKHSFLAARFARLGGERRYRALCSSAPLQVEARSHALLTEFRATPPAFVRASQQRAGPCVAARPAQHHCPQRQHTWLRSRAKFATGRRSAGIGFGCSAVLYSKARHARKLEFNA